MKVGVVKPKLTVKLEGANKGDLTTVTRAW